MTPADPARPPARLPRACSVALALAVALGPAACAGPAASRSSQEVPPLQPFQIRTVQRELRVRGLAVEATGVLDEGTRAALSEYQASRGLPRTGLPDRATLWKLGVDADPMYNCETNDTVDCSPPPD